MISTAVPVGRRLRWRLGAYAAVAMTALRSMLMYRAGLAISVAVLLVQVLALRFVWTSVYADRAAVAGNGGVGEIGLSTQLAYVSLSSVQYWLLNQWSPFSLHRRIREGKIGTDLMRPIGVLPQAAMARLGTVIGGLPFAVVAIPLAMLFGAVATPAGPVATIGFLASTAMAVVIAVQLGVLLETLAFWMLEIGGVWLSYSLVSRFFSGSLVPLWFMPEWLRVASTVLPFQTTTYAPVAIYLGTVSGTGLMQSLAVSACWIVLLWLITRLVWSRAVRRVVIQGG